MEAEFLDEPDWWMTLTPFLLSSTRTTILRSKVSSIRRSIMSSDKKITDWASKDGQFKRQDSQFRNEISKDAGAKFPAEKNRYHLYVSLACPWAHRTLIVRELKGLKEIIPVSVVHWEMLEGGWRFPKDDESCSGATKDNLYDSAYLKDIYFKADKNYSGRYTVPTLWDSKNETIVSNESADIIRMFYTAFDDVIDSKYKGVTYYPDALKKDIDSVNEWVYNTVNNGVYKSGFATTQDAYESNVVPLFDSLNKIEEMLHKSAGPYLLGKELTEADIRLFPTIVRFDPVYVQHFKCDLGTIRHNYPYINKWLKNLYWNNDAFKFSTNFEHIKKHYTKYVIPSCLSDVLAKLIDHTSKSTLTQSHPSGHCLMSSQRTMERSCSRLATLR